MTLESRPTGRATVREIVPQAEFEQRFTELFRHVKRVKRDLPSGTVNTTKRGDLLLPTVTPPFDQDDVVDISNQNYFPPVIASRAEKILFTFETKHGNLQTFLKTGKAEDTYVLQIATYTESQDDAARREDPLVLTIAFDTKEARDDFRNLTQTNQRQVRDRVSAAIEEGRVIEKTHEEFGSLYMMSDTLLTNLMTLNKEQMLLQKAAAALALKEFALVTAGTVARATNPIVNDIDAIRYIVALLEDADGNVSDGRENEHQQLTKRIALLRERETKKEELPVNELGWQIRTGLSEKTPADHSLGPTSERPKPQRLNRFVADRLAGYAAQLLEEVTPTQKEAIALRNGPQELLAPIVSKELGSKASRTKIRDFFIRTAQSRGSTLGEERLGEIFDSNKWESILEK